MSCKKAIFLSALNDRSLANTILGVSNAADSSTIHTGSYGLRVIIQMLGEPVHEY
jgi:hypothetical protein